MSWRTGLRRAVGGVLNVSTARLTTLRRVGPPVVPLDLEAYRRLAAPAPLDTASLLCGRSNRGRARVLEAVLQGLGPVEREPYQTLEGRGVNLFADLRPRAARSAPPTVVLAAHHDAVPGSPGANDNAAGIGILLALRRRLDAAPLERLAVRLAFFAGEERAMLGSRVHVRRAWRRRPPSGLVGVVSLELCGIGDTFAVWDVTPPLERTPLLQGLTAAAEALGARRDAGYYLTEPVPFFGSDHRPFAERGVPGVGLTMVPAAAVEPLRAFIYGGLRGVLVPPARRPEPFTTYHTAGDSPATLQPETLARVVDLLEQLVRRLD